MGGPVVVQREYARETQTLVNFCADIWGGQFSGPVIPPAECPGAPLICCAKCSSEGAKRRRMLHIDQQMSGVPGDTQPQNANNRPKMQNEVVDSL